MSKASVAVVRPALRSLFHRSLAVLFAIFLCTCVVWAAIALSTSTPYSQNFDGMGIPATSTTASALPADFRVDNPATVRTVGTYAAALTSVARAGGASLSTTAANGIYSFGSGTTSLGGSDRAVGFLSSGTATASGNLYAQFNNNTGSDLSSLQISYAVEKYRGGINAAGFRIQLFYSSDGSTWTSAGNDFLTTFAADATNNGFATTPGLTVPVSSTLTVAIPNGANFYLAWNYSVASGTTTTNAQALAVDDISILGVGNGPTNPTAFGLATPNSITAGNPTLLTVAVTPGTNPASSGLAVAADLTSIGGSATQQFFDDGTHGDVTPGDNTFSFNATVPIATAAGAKSLTAAITDAQSRSASTSISLTVTPASTPATGVGTATPSSLQAANNTLLTVKVTPGTNPVSSGITVSGDLSSIGGSATQNFFDDGTHGDATPGDNTFSFQAAITSGTAAGSKSLPITISDAQSRTSTATISLTVQPPPPPTTVKISQVYGGGGNSGSTFTNDFVELFNQGSTAVDLAGWSVQYVSAAATTTWQVSNICPTGPCLLQPGHYFLVQESQGAGGTTPLPTPDFAINPPPQATIALSGNNGNVALVASTTALSAGCHFGGSVVDVVAYGTGVCGETAASGALVATTASVRRGNGCIDTDNNSADFVTVGPIPRNSASPANFCVTDPGQPSGLGIATPDSIDPASNTLLTVKVTPATTPPSTNVSVLADLSSLGGSSTQQLFDDGTHGDVTAGDNIFSYEITVGALLPTGTKSVVAAITDGEGRNASAPITLTIQSLSCGVERWSVKVGTDPDANQVDLNNVVRGNIFDLGLLPPPPDPPGPPDNARLAPTEKTVYVVNALLTFYKKETDVDYHIVLQDPAGHTLIAEIPSPGCLLTSGSPRVQAPSPFGPGIAAARQSFDSHLNAQTFFQTANIPVQIKGVGFFDFKHGQTGVAPNGIELHPVIAINFTTPTTTVLASALNPSAYGQAVAVTATVSNGGVSTPTGNVSLFDAGTLITTTALAPNGQATFNLTGLTVGPHSLVATYEGDSTSAESKSDPLAQTVNKADQTIDFGALSAKTFGDPDFTVTATASSNLPVSFTIQSGPATISGNTVHITGAGSVTVRASQAGNDNYNAAPDVDRSFNIATANQAISFAALGPKTYGDAPFSVSATGGASGNPVTFAATGNCTINGSTVTITGGGSCTVTASQAGNSNYNAAPDVPRTFTINRANAVVTVSGYAGTYDGSAHGATGSATGVNSEDLASLLDLGASFTNYPGGTANWSFAGNSDYNSASGSVSIVINKATPAFSNLSSPVITLGATPTTLGGKLTLGSLVPTGSVSITLHGVTQTAAIGAGGAFSSSFATGALPAVNPPYDIAYSYAGDNNFNPASGTGTLTVGYAILPLFDQAKAAQGGSTIPIKLQLTNLAGANVSSSSTVVTAVKLVQISTNASSDVSDSGNANPDGNFRFDGSGYIFNLSTKGLATGTYQLVFTVSGDATPHSVNFQVR